MEARLEQLIIDLERVTNLRNLSPTNPIVTRLSNPSVSTVTVIISAMLEPSNAVLPLNVTWFDMDPQSDNYRRALRRVSKTPSNGFDNTWEVITAFDDVFVAQYYDSADTERLTGAQSVSPATVESAGTVRLSAAPVNPASPIAVVETDGRLSDAREPLAHSHPQDPAVALKTASTNVIIGGSTPPAPGDTLVATGPTTAVWRPLTTSDIQ